MAGNSGSQGGGKKQRVIIARSVGKDTMEVVRDNLPSTHEADKVIDSGALEDGTYHILRFAAANITIKAEEVKDVVVKRSGEKRFGGGGGRKPASSSQGAEESAGTAQPPTPPQ